MISHAHIIITTRIDCLIKYIFCDECSSDNDDRSAVFVLCVVRVPFASRWSSLAFYSACAWLRLTDTKTMPIRCKMNRTHTHTRTLTHKHTEKDTVDATRGYSPRVQIFTSLICQQNPILIGHSETCSRVEVGRVDFVCGSSITTRNVCLCVCAGHCSRTKERHHHRRLRRPSNGDNDNDGPTVPNVRCDKTTKIPPNVRACALCRSRRRRLLAPALRRSVGVNEMLAPPSDVPAVCVRCAHHPRCAPPSWHDRQSNANAEHEQSAQRTRTEKR